ncbi:MAG: gamma-glutamyltransferase [Candidatus Poribacteria bacterium]|nr:gamma-glutamyltransferase [Candidatus Poribacteria bacterium]
MQPDYREANRFGPARSAVITKHGMVATSQPLAALAGVDILRQGGNAFDAAVATAAMLNVVEPMSTGIGGDAFAILYDARSGEVRGLNASGRSSYGATLEEWQRRLGANGSISGHSIEAVTVPGAADGWLEVVGKYGNMTMADVLAPAIQAAEDGFAVTPQIGASWRGSRTLLSATDDSRATWLYGDGSPPQPGKVFRNPRLGRTFRLVAEGGRQAFYEGEIASKFVKCSNKHGGVFTMKDMKDHTSTWVEPISVNYRGYDVLEIPPNGQGIAALEALKVIEFEDIAAMGFNTPDTLHLELEAMKLAFHDRNRYVTDPEFAAIPIEGLLSDEYARAQRARISMERAIASPTHGVPPGTDTVYLCAADADGNVVSFINSLYAGWGSGITAEDTGIMLQNRGQSFSLDPNHVNVIAPHKRTRHTIIPALLMRDGRPIVTFGIMGGDMQAQGHVQFVSNMVDHGMNVQDAMDAPRWRYNGQGNSIALERWIDSATWNDLRRRGHAISGSDGFFGGGQAIYVDHDNGTYHGGSDPRRDGCAIGY